MTVDAGIGAKPPSGDYQCEKSGLKRQGVPNPRGRGRLVLWQVGGRKLHRIGDPVLLRPVPYPPTGGVRAGRRRAGKSIEL